MKAIYVIVAIVSCLIAVAHGCSDNAVFSVCVRTAKMALSKCEMAEMADTKDVCRCSAQKQMLACFAECSDDPATYELETKQIDHIKQTCNAPGVEMETSFVADVANPEDVREPKVLMHYDFGKSHADFHDAEIHSSAASTVLPPLALLSVTVLFFFIQ
ncbi:hypothetical protein BC940DRAFT_332296 [Gongronella butleri]|nr:hypothetical protein BC940DRAFT_332296 [Gongronella butleri]